MRMQIVFHRFNTGGNWGLGHLYRNLVLMNVLRDKGYSCIALINKSPIAESMLTREGFAYHIVNELENAEELVQTIYYSYGELSKNNYCIFWDRLNSSKEYIKTIISAGIRIITFGNYDDSSFLATEAIISREVLVAGKKPHYSGPSYQIFNREVLRFAAEKRVIHRVVNQVVIHFGGTDPLHVLSFVFEAIKDLKNVKFILIDGKSGTNHSIEEQCQNIPNIEYHLTVQNFVKLLFESDICMLAGGVSMFEASAVGTPMINICQNSDQVIAADIFQNRTGSINLGLPDKLSTQRITKSLLELCKDYSKRTQMSENMKKYVDGKGTERIVGIIDAIMKPGE